MSPVLTELIALLALERIEENLFRGQSQDLGWGTVFGGQVLGQALSAAVQTVPPERHVHSLHAYFLRPGDVARPIVYDVDRIRDGRARSPRGAWSRSRAASAIFNLSASFQVDEPGFEHQDAMPDAPPPESLPTEQERLRAVARAGARRSCATSALAERPFELRPADPIDDDPFRPAPRAARADGVAAGSRRAARRSGAARYLLAYASDYAFVDDGARCRTASPGSRPGMQVACLDHVMWFHQPFRVDEWLLHVMDSPTAHGARGLVRGPRLHARRPARRLDGAGRAHPAAHMSAATDARQIAAAALKFCRLKSDGGLDVYTRGPS